MASQGRRRAETVRWRQHLGLGRRNPARDDQQEPHRGIQAQLVNADPAAAPGPFPGKIEHCRILAAMRSKSAALMPLLTFVVRGSSALATHAKQGKKPMNAIRSEKAESTEVEDPGL